MTGPGRPFSADELGDVEDAEMFELLRTAREVESEAGRVSTQPTADFTERVLAAVASEPSPDPLTVATNAARTGRWGAVVAAVRDGWHVAFGPGRPIGARASALALVLIAAIGVTSIGGVATVGALRLLTNDAAPPPSVPIPMPSPSPSPSPTPSASPTDTPRPTPTDDPSPTATDDKPDSTNDNSGPGSTDDNGGNGGAASTDDNGGNRGPGSTDDSSGSGSDGSSGGSGSGGSGSGSDGGGSGSGVSGSGSDDSSGSGSGSN